MPNRIRTVIRIAGPKNLIDTLDLVKDEEWDFKDNHLDKDANWTRVEKRRTRPQPLPRQPTSNPNYGRWQNLGGKPSLENQNGYHTRGSRQLECFTCREPGHFAWECRYTSWRNGQRGGNREERRGLEEPMEVNELEAQPRQGRWIWESGP